MVRKLPLRALWVFRVLLLCWLSGHGSLGAAEPMGAAERVGTAEPVGAAEPVGTAVPAGTAEPVGTAVPESAEASGLAMYEGFHLSPDGRMLLMLRADADHYNLVVRPFDAQTAGPDAAAGSAAGPASTAEQTIVTGSEDGGLINWCRWASSERILCSMRRYRKAGRAGQIINTRLLAVNVDGSDRLDLIPHAKNYDRRPAVWNPQVQDRIISWLPDDPAHILVQLNRDSPNRPSVYRLNINTNRLSRVLKPRSAVRRWYASSSGEILMASGYRAAEVPVLYRFSNRRLEPFAGAGFNSEIPATPLAFSADAASVYVNMTAGEDRHGIYEVDIASGEVKRQVYADSTFDVFALLLMDPDSGEPAGLRYERHQPVMVWLDENLRQEFEALSRRLPGTHVEPISSDDPLNRFVVRSYGGIVPAFYLFDRSAGALRLIGRQHPNLADEDVVPLQPISYPARDGMQLPGYLAVPKPDAGRVRAPVPTIILPHGGPYARDSAAFDYWTQFLVGEGYAVFKPNYRGSVGYGEAFMRSGYRQWGLKMQEDVLDGLDWLIEQGVTDPGRVCVVGASFGGYTALVSAFKFPDRIRCAVSFAGIADLDRLVERIHQFDLSRRNRIRIQGGDALLANSPIHQAERIEVPLLIVHGDADSVVRVRQSQRLVKALDRHGKEYRYVEQPDGDHFLSSKRQNAEFFDEMRAFLDLHVGGGAQR